MKRTLFGLLTLSTCLWLGCNRSTTVTTPDGEEVTISEGNGDQTVTIQGPDGEMMTITQDGDAARITFDGQGEVTMSRSGDGGGRVTTSGKNTGDETFTLDANEEGTALPDDFPEDVPVYPGGVVMSCTTVGTNLQVVMRTTDTMQKVKTVYQDELRALGWNMAESLDMGQVALLSAEKDGRILGLTITPVEEEGSVMLSLHVETEG